MLVVALEANGLVLVRYSPALGGFHELRTDAVATVLGQHAVEPREERVGLQFEAEEEADRAVLDPRDHLQHVVAPLVAALERFDGLRRAEDLVV